MYQHDWLEVDEDRVGEIRLSLAIDTICKEAVSSHVRQVLFSPPIVTLTNHIYYQDEDCDDKGDALWVDQVPVS